jgi:hypothetical protein
MDISKVTTEPSKSKSKSKYICIYNDKKCCKDKLCGDCGLDLYESEKYQESVDNFNIDRKISLNK